MNIPLVLLCVLAMCSLCLTIGLIFNIKLFSKKLTGEELSKKRQRVKETGGGDPPMR